MAVELITTGTTYVDAGESSRYRLTFDDFDSDTIAKAAITAITLDVVAADGTAIVDGRDVLDANDGTLAADGTLTLYVGPDDNAYQGTTGTTETHTFMVTWTWTDDTPATRTGQHKWDVRVRRLPS